MNGVTIIWSVAAGACLTLGVMHLLTWRKSQKVEHRGPLGWLLPVLFVADARLPRYAQF